MVYSKNLLFLFFAHWFLWSILINNIFEYHISFKVLAILWVLFLLYMFLKKKFLYYFSVIILWMILWIIISQIHIFENNNKNEIIIQNSHDYKKYTLEIQQLSKKDKNENYFIAKVNNINEIIVDKKIYIEIKVANMYQLNQWDIIQTQTKIYPFQNTADFAYKSYMNSKNTFWSAFINSYELIWNNQINILQKFSLQLRENMLDKIYKIYPENEAIFLWWILLWARESLSDEIKENFNNSGLTHFIAVSWFNITILIIFFGFLVKYFPRIIQFILMSFFIIFFVMIVWDTAPVIRAAIMWVIWYAVLLSWRNSHSYTLVVLSGLIMVLISPSTLSYDVSFHLSFLAVLGIIFTQVFWKKIFFFVPSIFAIREALVLTFAAMVFTLPIMIFNFGQLSIMSPFANIAVTWTIPIAMALGFISIIFYYISPIAWEISGYFARIFLKFDMLMVDFFWNLDFSVVEFDFWIYKTQLFILYFLVMIFLVLYFRENVNTKKEVA